MFKIERFTNYGRKSAITLGKAGSCVSAIPVNSYLTYWRVATGGERGSLGRNPAAIRGPTR